MAGRAGGLCDGDHIPDLCPPPLRDNSMIETVTVQPCEQEGVQMTDILNAETQERLHRENQEAIAQIRSKLDLLISQNEEQSRAMRIITGAPQLADLDALIKFRDEHRRLLSYDRRITGAAESITAWILRIIFAGAVALVVLGMSVAGLGDALKAWLK